MDSSRNRILRAAAEVYTEAGFKGTTTRRIAEVAEVNEITLFRQFGNKDALVKAALMELYQQEHPVMLGEPVDPPSELYNWAHATVHHWHEARHLIFRVMGDLLEYPALAPDVCREPAAHHERLSAYLRRMQERGLTSHEFVPEAAAGMMLGSVFSHAVWREHLKDRDMPPLDVIVQHYVQLLLNAVGYKPVAGKKRKEKA